MKPDTKLIGARITSPKTNIIIAADFPAIYAYNLLMLDEENSRLKRLLVATTVTYFLGWIIGLGLARFVNSDNYIFWMFERPWILYVTWFFIFLGYCWIPLSLFLLAQGFLMKKKYSEISYSGDKTVGNLSLVAPLVFFAIYVFTRVLYGA